jgi:hypothetical protein
MGSDRKAAGKISARKRLLQEGQGFSEPVFIISLLSGDMHFVQLGTDETPSL